MRCDSSLFKLGPAQYSKKVKLFTFFFFGFFSFFQMGSTPGGGGCGGWFLQEGLAPPKIG